MNYVIDIIIFLCLAWGAFKGFRKGFIIQSFVIIALILAICGGFAFAGMLESFMQKHFNVSHLACSIISFIIIFLLILTLVYASGYLVSKVADATSLGMINRLTGAVFGLIANALVLSVLIMLFNRVNDAKQFVKREVLEKTYLYEPVGKMAPTVFPERFFRKLFN